MPDILNPFDNPTAFDKVRVGQVLSPGLCTISGFKRKHDFDRKKGKGSAGETITFVQLPAAEGTLTFTFWDRESYNAWPAFAPLFKYNPAKKEPTPIDIFHPWLAEIDIASVVATSVSAREHKGKGRYEVTVDLLEYRPPPAKSIVSTPTGSKSNAVPAPGVGSNPDPIADAQQKEIARLLAEAQKP